MGARNRYFGKICGKHPGLKGERLRFSRSCVACQAEAKKRWTLENADRVRESHRLRQRRRRVSAREYQRLRRAKNPALIRGYHAKYRALKRSAVPALTVAEHLRIHMLYAEAARRTAETGIVHHVDHDTPLALGGLHHPDNLIVVPASLNLAKGARYRSTWDFISS